MAFPPRLTFPRPDLNDVRGGAATGRDCPAVRSNRRVEVGAVCSARHHPQQLALAQVPEGELGATQNQNVAVPGNGDMVAGARWVWGQDGPLLAGSQVP